MGGTQRAGAAVDWRDGVKIVRGASLREAMSGPHGSGRVTAYDFAGGGSGKTWVGSVVLAPATVTGAHHHGRHEVMFYVVRGAIEVRWGERLELAADLGPGDLAYFAPGVPHQERNPSADDTVELLVVRSDDERIAVPLESDAVPEPQRLA